MKPSSSQSLASRVALTYAFFGALWILFSDQILATLVGDTATLTQLQTLKGWFYVSVTAVLVYPESNGTNGAQVPANSS